MQSFGVCVQFNSLFTYHEGKAFSILDSFLFNWVSLVLDWDS